MFSVFVAIKIVAAAAFNGVVFRGAELVGGTVGVF